MVGESGLSMDSDPIDNKISFHHIPIVLNSFPEDIKNLKRKHNNNNNNNMDSIVSTNGSSSSSHGTIPFQVNLSCSNETRTELDFFKDNNNDHHKVVSHNDLNNTPSFMEFQVNVSDP